MTHLASLILAVDDHEPSKTPFYIVGGAFAAWAVIVSVIGMRAPEFPKSTGQLRGVLGLSAALMVAAVATAIITS